MVSLGRRETGIKGNNKQEENSVWNDDDKVARIKKMPT